MVYYDWAVKSMVAIMKNLPDAGWRLRCGMHVQADIMKLGEKEKKESLKMMK
jgi:hypothetical protein